MQMPAFAFSALREPPEAQTPKLARQEGSTEEALEIAAASVWEHVASCSHGSFLQQVGEVACFEAMDEGSSLPVR